MAADVPGLDGLREWLEALDNALNDPDWTGELPHPAPIPTEVLTGPDADASALLVHASRTRYALIERMAKVSEELDGMHSRVGAARSYISHDSSA